MNIRNLLLAFLFLTGAIILPFFFEKTLYFAVGKIGIGWVFATVLIRIIVIVLFTSALKKIFSLFNRTKKIKNWGIILIGLIPGFLISFAIFPIYDKDYGMFNDDIKIEEIHSLNDLFGPTYHRKKQFEVLAFLEVGCGFCEVACQKLGTNLASGQKIPINLFFGNNETEDYIINFLKRNNGEKLPYHVANTPGSFVNFSGFQFPSIFLINPDGETVFHWVGDRMNYTALDYLLELEQ